MVAAFGITVIIQTLYLGICALLHVDRTSWLASLIWGFVAGMIVIPVLGYYAKPGKDRELLPQGKEPPAA
jgi:hypothetical protein